METPDKYLQILQHYWGYADFRGIQRQIIESIASGKDTLGLMPTGGGKSITFQVPALAQEGVCIVITPLISLMKDQVDHLRRWGIQASAIHSGMPHTDIVQTLDNAVYGGVKLLYVSPERLQSELFQIKITHMQVSFITVDEAHCISQWGYDFRPSYLQIANIRRLLPHAPVLALTATATPNVIDDIQDKLLFREKRVFKMSFQRENLSYIVRYTLDLRWELVHILQAVSGSAIVYVRSRVRSADIAQFLNQEGISATFYHAGLDDLTKDVRQNDWQQGKTRVIVATNAFGMGIDKPDVRLVIHYDFPNTLEEYFQEAGRAGRDGKRSYAVLMYTMGSVNKARRRINASYPPKDFIRQVYDELAYFFEIGIGSGGGVSFIFDVYTFSKVFKHPALLVQSAIEILHKAGYIYYDPDPDSTARLKFTIDRDDLYKINSVTTGFENDLIVKLLRRYEGLFSEYRFIDERLLAQELGVSRQQVYMELKSLNSRHIVSFIPQRSLPRLTYVLNRVDGKDVVLSKDVYDRRKEEFVGRLETVMNYMRNNDVCRSVQLLGYFGEKDAKPCGHCDVCITDNSADIKKILRKKVLQLLSDGEKHSEEEISKLDIPHQYQLVEVLKEMIDREEIFKDETFLYCPE